MNIYIYDIYGESWLTWLSFFELVQGDNFYPSSVIWETITDKKVHEISLLKIVDENTVLFHHLLLYGVSKLPRLATEIL